MHYAGAGDADDELDVDVDVADEMSACAESFRGKAPRNNGAKPGINVECLRRHG